MSEAYIGEIRMFGGNFAPVGWALCSGQLLSISQYTALFSILGTSYGGDGVRTFGLPNLQGTVPIGWGSARSGSSYTIGETAGVENVSLLQNNMPSHSHGAFAVNTGGGSGNPQNNLLGSPLDANQNPTTIYAPSSQNVQMAPQMIGPAGGSQPHPNMQPYLCVTFIISLNGIYPSRS